MDACYKSQKNPPESKETKVDMTRDTEIKSVSVIFKKHTKRKCNAPSDSNFRDLYTLSIGNSSADRDCWWWWRDPIDGIIRILGGNAKTNEPTIYMITLKEGKISVPKDEDQSKAWGLYNQYGRK